MITLKDLFSISQGRALHHKNRHQADLSSARDKLYHATDVTRYSSASTETLLQHKQVEAMDVFEQGSSLSSQKYVLGPFRWLERIESFWAKEPRLPDAALSI